MSRILLLASYPKSGNTWLRVFFSNLRGDRPHPADINSLDSLTAANQSAFDDAVGVEAASLFDDEIDLYRPCIYRYLGRVNAEALFLKIHEAYRLGPDGEPLIPAETVSGAIYILRNPLDVAVSLASHLNCSIDRVVADVMAREYMGSRRFPGGQLRERLLPWHQHVLSWVDQKDFPLHVVRYEDMKAQPIETFSAIARFSGLPCDADRIRKAVDHSAFDILQEQEREHGFRERPSRASSLFFRSGRAGAWRDVLSKSQVERIVRDHGDVMWRFGYLPADF